MNRTLGNKIATTTEAMSILAQCKKLLGRNYKVAIRHGWQTGNYGPLADLACELQQIRNNYGPAWLEREVV